MPTPTGMQTLLGLVGLVVAIAVWKSGHPFLGIITGFLLVGGAGWMLPVWLTRAALRHTPSRKVRNAQLDDLVAEWRRRGNAGFPPVELGKAYLRGHGTKWTNASRIMDYALPSERIATPGRITVPAIAQALSPGFYEALEGDGVLTMDDDGFIFFRHESGQVCAAAEGVARWRHMGTEDAEENWIQWTYVTLDGLDVVVSEGEADTVDAWLKQHYPKRYWSVFLDRGHL